MHCTFSYSFNAFSSQVKHYQFRQVCLATGLNPAPSPDILLLAWARSAPGLEQVFDFYLIPFATQVATVLFTNIIQASIIIIF